MITSNCFQGSQVFSDLENGRARYTIGHHPLFYEGFECTAYLIFRGWALRYLGSNK